jgi:TonB family protein
MSEDKHKVADAVPSRIGRYEITGTLGFGAMGAVYKAYDPLIKRTLAIKTIRIDVPRQGPQHRAFIERFYQEARISGTLSHPAIVTLFDIGEENGVPFLAMEFIEGRTIAALLEEGNRFKPERVIGLVSQVADALDYAHSRGVIHRDIKPSNLIVREGDKVKVTDFGIAKLADSEITHSGALLGTPSYMSPEQAMGERLDGRSDIFSLGVVAFEMLSGQQPFPGANVTSILYKLVHVEPIEPANLEMNGLVPQKWREVFHKVLAKKPDNRYQSAASFVQDLEYCLGSWFAGLAAEETATLPLPAPEETTVAIERLAAIPPAPGGASEQPRLEGPVGEEPEVEATLVLETPATVGPQTARLPVPPPVEPAQAAPTVVLSPPAASKTLPPGPTVRERRTAVGSTPARRRRTGPPVGWILVGSAVIVIGLAGLILRQRSLASAPIPEPTPAEAEPSSPPFAAETPAPPASGALLVESEPPGARVRVDGQVRGETPLDLPDMPLGTHRVRVELRGYEPQSREVTLDAAGPSAELRLTLTRTAAAAFGAVDVLSTPAGARVSLDGRVVDRTPLTIPKLKPGKHAIELTLEGHEPWTGSVDVAAGETGRVEVRLAALPAPPAPPTPEPVDPERVYENTPAQVDTLAKRLSGRSPSYPSDRAKRLKSDQRVSVVVRFVVGETGEVRDVSVVESAGTVVDDVVVAAVRTWKYQPATKQGVKVKVSMLFKQTFVGG